MSLDHIKPADTLPHDLTVKVKVFLIETRFSAASVEAIINRTARRLALRPYDLVTSAWKDARLGETPFEPTQQQKLLKGTDEEWAHILIAHHANIIARAAISKSGHYISMFGLVVAIFSLFVTLLPISILAMIICLTAMMITLRRSIIPTKDNHRNPRSKA